ncbi:MAG TPA: ABC transporter ATP-binding protein [Chloroflexota bacterium]
MVNAVFGLELKQLCKSFGTTVAADNVDLQVTPGELISLLGPSGCGKTTTLRMIGGFVEPDSGEILIGGDDVTGVPANKRDCGFVFQSYALFPHMTVFDNVAYGLNLRKVPKSEIKARVHQVVEMLNLSGMEGRYPKQLSGGQQQRVAIARALAISPRLFLLDEPLSNLDAKLRERVRFELRAIQKQTGITTIFVTHDQSEAMVLSDRIAVMNQGRIEQVGTPEEIYFRPRTKFVADFIGQNNFIEGELASSSPQADTAEVLVGGRRLLATFDQSAKPGQKVIACIRPEFIQILPAGASTPDGETNLFEGKIILAAFLGSEWRYEVRTDAGFVVKVCLQTNQGRSMSVGDTAAVRWLKKDTYIVLQ